MTPCVIGHSPDNNILSLKLRKSQFKAHNVSALHHKADVQQHPYDAEFGQHWANPLQNIVHATCPMRHPPGRILFYVSLEVRHFGVVQADVLVACPVPVENLRTGTGPVIYYESACSERCGIPRRHWWCDHAHHSNSSCSEGKWRVVRQRRCHVHSRSSCLDRQRLAHWQRRLGRPDQYVKVAGVVKR